MDAIEDVYILTRCFQSSKVTVLGAAGGIGQPLSLLLKLNPRVSQLSLYDIRLAPGTPIAPPSAIERILTALQVSPLTLGTSTPRARFVDVPQPL